MDYVFSWHLFLFLINREVRWYASVLNILVCWCQDRCSAVLKCFFPCRTSRMRWLCSLMHPSGFAGVWSRWPSGWATASLTSTSGWSEPPPCISTSLAAITTLWRVTCLECRSTPSTPVTLERFTTSGNYCLSCHRTLVNILQTLGIVKSSSITNLPVLKFCLLNPCLTPRGQERPSLRHNFWGYRVRVLFCYVIIDKKSKSNILFIVFFAVINY